MKELIIGFLIALVVSSYIAGQPENASANGWNFAAKQADSPGVDLVDEVNEGTFQGEVLDSHEPVLVEFFEENNAACTEMKPVLSKIAQESQGYLRLYKVNAKTNPVLTEKYEATVAPTYVLLSQGKVLNSTSGILSQKDLSDWVKRELDMPTN